MVYRRVKQKVRRVYSRGKSIFSGDLFKNPYFVGIAAGAVKNALSGKKIIDIESVKNRILKMDGTNPLILLGLGILAKNPILAGIGLFGIVDPPEEKKEEYARYSNIGGSRENTGYLNIREIQENTGYSNIGESQEPSGYSNIGETQETVKKRFVY